jgi:hypothetical protein
VYERTSRRRVRHRKARHSAVEAVRRTSSRDAAVAANVDRQRRGGTASHDSNESTAVEPDDVVLDPSIPTHDQLRGCEQDPALAQAAFYRMLGRPGLWGLSDSQRDDAMRDLTTVCGPPVDDAAKLECAEAYAAVMSADNVECVGCAVCGEAVLGNRVQRVPLRSPYLQQLGISVGRESLFASVPSDCHCAYSVTWPVAPSPMARPLALNAAYVSKLADGERYTGESIADVCDGCHVTLWRLPLKPSADGDGADSINDLLLEHIRRYDVNDGSAAASRICDSADAEADEATVAEHKQWSAMQRLRLRSVPKYSCLMLDLGRVPSSLPALTTPEQILLGLTRMNLLLKINAVGRQQQSRGHAILFGHEGLDPLTQDLIDEHLVSIGNDNQIPALRLSPGSVSVCLVGARTDCDRLCGGNTPAGHKRLAAACGSLLQVRPEALFAWARFLKAVHPAFRDLLVREETAEVCATLAAIPEALVRDAQFAVSEDVINTERLYGIGFGTACNDVAGVRTTRGGDESSAATTRSGSRAVNPTSVAAAEDTVGVSTAAVSATEHVASDGVVGGGAPPPAVVATSGAAETPVVPAPVITTDDGAAFTGPLDILLLDPVLICGDRGTVTAPAPHVPSPTLQALLAALEADNDAGGSEQDPSVAGSTSDARPSSSMPPLSAVAAVIATAVQSPPAAAPPSVGGMLGVPQPPAPVAAATATPSRATRPPVHIHRDSEPGNEFLLKSHLITTAFATLFVLGTSLMRSATMSTDLSRHLLMQADKRFGRDIRFIFLAFNQLVRHRVCHHVSLRSSTNPESFLQLHEVCASASHC